MSLVKIKKELQSQRNPDKALVLSGFFKTGKGQYGEGDKFLGLTILQQRAVAQKYYQDIDLDDVAKLLADEYHEVRLTGSLILVAKYEKSKKEKDKIVGKQIFDFYLQHTEAFNNWDLVDLTSSKIVGDYLLNKQKNNKRSRAVLYELAKSDNLWSRRISIVSTFAFIRNNQFEDTIKLSEILINDKHDLMHKAVGWMLREVGKRDKETLTNFLDEYIKQLPRTTLRYAIERFPEAERKGYLGR